MLRSRVLGLLGLTLCLAIAVHGQAHMSCSNPTPYFGPSNNLPINQLSSSTMKLIGTVPNGKAYMVTVPNNGGNTTQSFYLTHVYGDAYSQGLAFGQLLSSPVTQFIDQAWNYIESQFESALLPYLPPWLADKIAELGLEAALDFVYDITVKYTDADFYDEMHGLCDGSGADYMTVRRLHMLPGLTKGACSMFGAWSKAVPTPSDGSNPHLLQLRALDWDMDGPFRDFSGITVYHPQPNNASQGNAWINIGMVGFIGALTGMSSAQMGISEIGVSFPDSSWGPPQGLVPIPGIPFVVMLRDILKYDYTIDDAITRMANAPRDCNLILGVGDGKLNEFRSFQYSPYVFSVFDDLNMRPNNDSWHFKIENVVYHGMDWNCPSFNYVLGTQLQKYWGNITAANSIQYISSVEQSGDNHLAYYDLTAMQLYVAFAAPHASGGPTDAYIRQFTQLDCASLFNEPPPSSKRV